MRDASVVVARPDNAKQLVLLFHGEWRKMRHAESHPATEPAGAVHLWERPQV